MYDLILKLWLTISTLKTDIKYFFVIYFLPEELTHTLNITKPKLMITSKTNLKTMENCAKQLDYIKYICPIDIICNTKTIQDNNNFAPTKYDNGQTAVILFSSGTTGLPKGVELSHKSIFLMTSVLKFV